MSSSPASTTMHSTRRSGACAFVLLAAFGIARSVEAAEFRYLGPDGGAVESIVFTGDADRLVVATFLAGVATSNNLGASWRIANSGLGVPLASQPDGQALLVARISRLAVDPTDPELLYASVGGSGVRQGFFRSIDGGSSWSASNEGLLADGQLPDIRSILVPPSTPQRVYLGTSGRGVFVSSDGGLTWQAINAGLDPVSSLTVNAVSAVGSEIWALTNRGVFRWLDAAQSWESLEDRFPQDLVFTALSIARVGAQRLVLGAAVATFSDGMILGSDDGGATFELETWLAVLPDPQPFPSIPQPFTLASPADDDELVFAGHDEGLARSDDGGRTWKRLPLGLGAVRSIALHPGEPQRMALATGQDGVLVSTNGGKSWARRNRGLRAQTFTEAPLLLSERGSLIVPATRLLRTDDFGVTWSDISEGLPGGAAEGVVSSASTGRLWAANNVAPPYRSDDGGESWVERSGLDPSTFGPFGPLVRRLVAHPANAEIALAGQLATGFPVESGGFLRTLDGGATWQRVFNARPEMANFQPEDVLWDPVDHNLVYFAVHYRDDESVGFTDGGIFASGDGGQSFVEVLDEMSFPAITRTGNGALYAMGGSNVSRRPGLWRSADDGATWQRAGAATLPLGLAARDLAADAQVDDLLFALLTDGSLWVSQDGGAGWGRIATDGLPDPRPQAIRLAVLPSFPRRILLATHGGLYEAIVECLPSPTALCLADGRYRVEASFRTSGAGAHQPAQTLPLTSDTGAFWFFGADNLELVVKLLDGCQLNDSFWVFAAGLTNVAVRLTVTDTWTAESKTYEHQAGTPYPVLQDTQAFAGCDTELDLTRR